MYLSEFFSLPTPHLGWKEPGEQLAAGDQPRLLTSSSITKARPKHCRCSLSTEDTRRLVTKLPKAQREGGGDARVCLEHNTGSIWRTLDRFLHENLTCSEDGDLQRLPGPQPRRSSAADAQVRSAAEQASGRAVAWRALAVLCKMEFVVLWDTGLVFQLQREKRASIIERCLRSLNL